MKPTQSDLDAILADLRESASLDTGPAMLWYDGKMYVEGDGQELPEVLKPVDSIPTP